MGRNNKTGQPKLLNKMVAMQCGIDPETLLPIKMKGSNPCELKTNIKRLMRIMDEQDAVNRGKWFNIPTNITSRDLERMLYYKFQLCLFYSKELQEFYILPFTLADDSEIGSLDLYGRYKFIKPIPFVGGATEDKKKTLTPIEVYLSKLRLRVVYAPLVEVKPEDLYECAVILQDYTPQLDNKNGEPRFSLNDPLLDVMAEIIPMLRTNLILTSGVKGVRVNDEDQKVEVYEGSFQLLNASLTGFGWIPLASSIEFQELTSTNTGKTQDYLLALQSIDNFRLSTYGIDNGGLFEKKAHTLQSEADVNGGPVGLVNQDCITIRQDFCNIVNSIWGVGMWYEPSETITKADINGDGLLYDRNEGDAGGYDAGTENGGDMNE